MVREMKTAQGNSFYELIRAIEQGAQQTLEDKFYGCFEIDKRSENWSLSISLEPIPIRQDKESKPDNDSPVHESTMSPEAMKESMAAIDARESVIKDLTSLVHHAASCPDDCDIGRVAVLADALHKYLADF